MMPTEINPSEWQTNLRLRREVLKLVTRVPAASPDTLVADYALIRRTGRVGNF